MPAAHRAVKHSGTEVLTGLPWFYPSYSCSNSSARVKGKKSFREK
jgi:hypothetical protein